MTAVKLEIPDLDKVDECVIKDLDTKNPDTTYCIGICARSLMETNYQAL